MDANNKSFFWGVLLGAAAAAIAGAVALACSLRISPLTGGTAAMPGKKGAGRRTTPKKSKTRR